MGVIPIVNENDTLAVSEIKFGDNDTLSAITGAMIHADLLFLMTDVDCLYDKNPRTNPDARAIEIVEDINEVEADGRFSTDFFSHLCLTPQFSFKCWLLSGNGRYEHQDHRCQTWYICWCHRHHHQVVQPWQYPQHRPLPHGPVTCIHSYG